MLPMRIMMLRPILARTGAGEVREFYRISLCLMMLSDVIIYENTQRHDDDSLSLRCEGRRARH